MKKRVASRKVSDTKKKKGIARKIKNASRTPEKTEEKKERTIAAKVVEKTTARKAKAGEKKVKKVKKEEKKKAAGEKEVSTKTEKREKTKSKGKSEEKITKTGAPGKKKTGKVVAATRRMGKTEEKAQHKRRKKVPPKSAGRVRISKAPAPKTAGKIKIKVVSEVSEKEKTSERVVKKKVVPSGAKEAVVRGAIRKSGKEEKPQRIVQGAGEGDGIKVTVGAGQVEAVKTAEVKELTGIQEAKRQREVGEKEARLWRPWAVLPEEYGENSVSLTTVDPHRLFAFWEVREETLKTFRGEVDIRVYDVTDIDFDTMDANSYFDVRADARIGKCYISVTPEREYVADVGIIFDGILIAVARSARVSTPRAAVPEEGILLYGAREADLRTGY